MAGKVWTKREDTVLRVLYPDCPMYIIQMRIDRTDKAIYCRASFLGLKRSDAFFEKYPSGRENLLKSGKATRFKKGMKPWNKGKEYRPGGRSSETWFKKGQKPSNARPVGYMSTRKDKCGRYYYFIKSETGMEPLHRYIWKRMYGELPKHAVIRFKDGNTLNPHPDNLERLTRAGNLEKNTVHRYPD